MAEPKKKLSKTRTNRRRAKYTVPAIAFLICKECGKPTRPHMVCFHCGFYDGKAVKNQAPTKRIVLGEETTKES